jgi:hypothetical protein
MELICVEFFLVGFGGVTNAQVWFALTLSGFALRYAGAGHKPRLALRSRSHWLREANY